MKQSESVTTLNVYVNVRMKVAEGGVHGRLGHCQRRPKVAQRGYQVEE